MAASKITLCWYAKTAKIAKKQNPTGESEGTGQWRYFPALFKIVHGKPEEARHGWVKENGQEVEYPIGRYVLRSYVNGKKVYTPIPSLNPRDAVIAWNRAKNAAGPQRKKDPKKLIATAVPAYIADCEARQAFEAAEQARLVLKEFQTVTKDVLHTISIHREHFLKFHDKLRKRGMSARTIANKDARVRSFLKFCGVDLKSVALALPPKPKFEEQLPEIYTPGELKAILEAADPYMGLAIRMALMLGLREQEVMYAEWADVDFHHAVFRVQGKKRADWTFEVKDKAQRDVPIPQELLAMLTSWQEENKGASLILGTAKGKPEGHLLRRLKQLAHEAGLSCTKCEGCTKRNECERWFLHKFRATFCTRMLRQADAKTVQVLAGHSDLETTLRYLAPASRAEQQAHANAIRWTE